MQDNSGANTASNTASSVELDDLDLEGVQSGKLPSAAVTAVGVTGVLAVGTKLLLGVK